MDFTPGVRYIDLPRLPGYLIGDDGSCWSRLRGKWRRLKGRTTCRGYIGFQLRKESGLCHTYLHSLVLEAFVGPRPEGMQCCHRDGDRGNNAATNLRWDTPRGNAADKILHGTYERTLGSKNGRSKLSESAVLELRELRKSGMLYRELADRFHVSKGTVRLAALYLTFKHVP